MRGPGNHKTACLGVHLLLASLPALSRLSTTSTVLPGIAFQVTVAVIVFLRVSLLGPKPGQQLSVELTLWADTAETKLHGL